VYGRRATIAAAVLLLPGCGLHDEVVSANLNGTDTVFVNAVRANTHTLWHMDDTDMALAGRDVCEVLSRGGTVDDAAHLLIPTTTVRGQKDAAYFANLAATSYCPQFPTTKPPPNG
jgi:hypothetical protein